MADTQVPSKLPKKSIKFNIEPNEEEIVEKKVYRRTELPRLPSVLTEARIELPDYEADEEYKSIEQENTLRNSLLRKSREVSTRLSKPNNEPRLTTLFYDIGLKRRSTVILRPVERFLPTYQLESNNPFNARVVEDIANMVVNDKVQTASLHPSLFENLARTISEDILFQIKQRNFNRYRILVTVSVGEKFFQSYMESLCVIWDIEKDSMASFIYDRSKIFIIVNVFGIYFE